MPRYRFDDEDVVVIVGSGRRGRDPRQRALPEGRQGRRAGGGPPPHARRLRQRRVALVQAARLARQPHDVRLLPGRQGLPEPARPGRARPSAARPPTGPAAARASWSTSSRPRRTTRGSRASTRSTGRSRSPTSSPTTTGPRRRWGSPGPTGIPQLPANNNYKVFANGAQRVGYKRFHTGRYASNPVPYDGRPATIQDGFNFQGDKNGSKWSTLTVELPQGGGDRQARPAPARRT